MRFSAAQWLLDDAGPHGISVYTAGGENIAKVSRSTADGFAGPPSEASANGRLIVNAPAMYHTIIALTNALRTFGPGVPKDEQQWTSFDEDALNAAYRLLSTIEED